MDPAGMVMLPGVLRAVLDEEIATLAPPCRAGPESAIPQTAWEPEVRVDGEQIKLEMINCC